ncbi:hypothetical protein ACP70R_045543 [Stipagrostis hirtigluma subsp. patula]
MEWRHVTLSTWFIFFLLDVGALAGTAVAAAPVRVGVILNLASATGLRMQAVVRMAVEDYYAAHPNSTARVELHFKDSPADPVEAIAAAEDLIKNARVEAIIGPEAAAEAELVAAVGSRAHVPVLAYSATSPPVSPSSDARLLVRTCADDSAVAAPVAGVLGSFGLREAVLLHEDSRHGSGVVPALADALRDAGGGVAARASVPPDAPDDRIDAALRSVAEATAARAFVVHASPSLARRLLRRAKDAGLMSRGSVWIATSAIGAGGGEGDRLTADDMDAMQGILIVRPHVQPKTRVGNFAARLKARLRREIKAGLPDIGGDYPTVPTLWAYDTAWAAAAAAEAAMASFPASHTLQESTAVTEPGRRRMSATGAALHEAVLGTSFDGLAGKFRLVDGQLQAPTYEITTITPKGPKTVGFWTAETKMIAQDSGNGGTNNNGIVWPGGASLAAAPKGWAAPPPGKELVVAVPVKNGFNQFVGVSGTTITGRPNVTGYCIDVFDAVVKALPYPVTYRYVPFNGSSSSYDLLLHLVPQKKADAVVGDVSITSARMGEVEYSMPFTDSGWTMVVPVRAGTSEGMSFFFVKPLTPNLWLASFVSFVFTGLVVWVIEHRINPEFRGSPSQEFGVTFYFAFSILVFAHKEKLESNLSRFLVVVFVFVVLILTSSYTASLTSMLTVEKLEPTVTDAKELIGKGDYVGYQEGSFVAGELRRMNFDESRMRSYGSPEQYAEALSRGSASGGVAAVFDEVPYLKLFLARHCGGGYAMAGPVYDGNGFGFAFPKGSPMASDVSRAIVSLTEGDELEKIKKRWFGEPGDCAAGGGGGGASTTSLGFWSFSGLFLVTGAATVLMLAAYLAAFVHRERGEVRAAEPGAGRLSLRRLRAWLQRYDSKDTEAPGFRRLGDAKQRPGGAAGKDDQGKATF